MNRRHQPCGTRAGYYWHRDHGEEPCVACREVKRQEDRARRRAQGIRPQAIATAEQQARAEYENPCGTKNAYDRHRSRGEEPDDLCRQGNNAYQRDFRWARARRRRGAPIVGRRKPSYEEWLRSIGLDHVADQYTPPAT